MLWLVFALMTATAIFAVLWPLSRRAQPQGGSDVAVYRDQLDEVARDRAAGLIGESEAEAAKIEVSRRLIAAADTASKAAASDDPSSLLRRRSTVIATFMLLPLGAVALYLFIGSPLLPGEPLAPRLAAIHSDRSIQSLIAQVENHLETNPDDARGWEVLAPIYLRLGRYDDAVNARRKVLALRGDSAAREADLGEALMVAANGIVTGDAKAAFDRAQALDPKDVKSRFFIGVAAEQDGKRDKAIEIWNGMLANAPSDAPWADNVRAALAQIGAAPKEAASPGPSAADVAAASGMSEKDRGAMIQTMVARLADKLKQDGSDVDGWQRLLRAYMVLGERDKAAAAASDARHALAADPDKLKKIDQMIKSLGLDG